MTSSDRSGEVASPPSPWGMSPAGLRRLGLLLLAVGVCWRIAHYLLHWPVWGDEAMLLVNYLGRDFLDLVGPIDHCQIAPILFQWTELAIIRWLASSDLALRLPALLAGIASLAVFWRLAGRTIDPLSRALATGLLAVTGGLVFLSAQAKPYAWDLLLSCTYLLLAVGWWQRPEKVWRLAALAALTPIALLASYAVVFVAGAISLVLAPLVWRQPGFRARGLFVLYNLLLVATFGAHYVLVSLSHAASPLGEQLTTAAGMHEFWKNHFPPASPVKLVPWLLDAHTGDMAAYPIGGHDSRSLLTGILAALGVWHLYRQGQKRLLLLFATIFALWFVAAALQKYPYGGAIRLAQHVAPAICILAGSGIAWVILLFSRPADRRRAILAVTGLFVLFAVGGVTAEVLRPFKTYEAYWGQVLADELNARAGNEPILAVQPGRAIQPTVLEWHLGRLGPQVGWGDSDAWEVWPHSQSRVWVISTGWAGHEEKEQIRARLASSGRPWRCLERTLRVMCPPGSPRVAFAFCRIYLFGCDSHGAVGRGTASVRR